MGEAKSIYCQLLTVRPDIAGEDVASITLQMDNAICNVELTFVTKTEGKHFPETTFFLEGTKGRWNCGLTSGSTYHQRRYPDQPLSCPRFAWADPAYDVNHASMVPLHQDSGMRCVRGAAGEHG
ncbi:MAG: hypothetical protein U0X20_13245 [Caldilineaceae bacterium]